MSEKELIQIKDILEFMSHMKKNVALEAECMDNKKWQRIIKKIEKKITQIYQAVYLLLEEL